MNDIRSIRNILSIEDTECLVHAVISNKLDYCNSLYYGISKKNIRKLQKVQNTAARIVVNGDYKTPIHSTLRDLHWLEVESRILFKILLIVHKCIWCRCSKNIIELLNYKQFTRSSSDHLLLHCPNVSTKYGKKSFSFTAPRLWNALPLNIRHEESTNMFKKNYSKHNCLMEKRI